MGGEGRGERINKRKAHSGNHNHNVKLGSGLARWRRGVERAENGGWVGGEDGREGGGWGDYHHSLALFNL